jgi:hypothetical protein
MSIQEFVERERIEHFMEEGRWICNICGRILSGLSEKQG